MARSNPVYYILPSAVNITPNANDSANDLSVYVSRGARIKVFCKSISELGYDDSNFQEWGLAGRNRRLKSNVPHTVYARLSKTNHEDGYIVFTPQTQENGVWTDKYPYVTPDGESGTNSTDYWWIKLGTLSAVASSSRTINIDTGILGTEQYNNQWEFEEDSLPLRVVISNDKDSGTPYVKWGDTIDIAASLVKGWGTDASALVSYWTIVRNTEDSASDDTWNAIDRSSGFGASGQITLYHTLVGTDDFNDAVAGTFTITAYGSETLPSASSDSSSSDSSDSPEIVALASASITILAETQEKYEIVPDYSTVHYNQMEGSYSPDDDITVNVRGIRQDGTMHNLTQTEMTNAGLTVTRISVASDSSSASSADDDDSEVALSYTSGVLKLPISVFSDKRSRLLKLKAGYKELYRTTVTFVMDGVDGQDGVTYRCRWRLSGADVVALAATSGGQIKNVNSQNATLVATLMKRVGSGAEEVVKGPGQVVMVIGNQSASANKGSSDDMTISTNASASLINSSSTTKVSVTFSLTDGNPLAQGTSVIETFNFEIEKLFDGSMPTITISNGYWYVNGVDTGVKAEGEDGTGVELKGTVDVVFTPSPNPDDLSSLEGLTGIDIGDCYVVDANRHLYFYNGSSSATSTEPYGWTDMGEFKGADGLNSYMHIAWADNIQFSSDSSSSSSSSDDELVPVSATGFTTVYGANGHDYNYDWIGFCTDNDINDPTTFASYKWNYQKGKDGSGYEYVYIRAKSETVPTIDETGTDGNSRSRTDDEYLPAVGNYNSSIFAGSRFTDDPQGVSTDWPCEYQAFRKKENGAWQNFSAATLHRKYGQNGAPGNNTATIFLYKRSATPITQVNFGILTYHFANKLLLDAPTGWSQNKIPSGTDPVYVTAATAYGSGTTDDIASNEWSTPVMFVTNGTDGQDGNNGAPGINSATVFLYKRSATMPAVPSSDLSYNFATGVLSGASLSGWEQTIPGTDGTPCWVTQATAVGTGTDDTITSTEWSTPSKMAEDGQDGQDGDDGVTYRCRWRLSGADVVALAATSGGQIKNVNSQNATLVATLMKRAGNGTEEVAKGYGRITLSFGSQAITANIGSGADMTASVSASSTAINSADINRISVTFSLTDGNPLAQGTNVIESFSYNIDKVFDGSMPTVTISNGYWYVNGVDTGVKAEGEDGTGVELKGTVDVVFTPSPNPDDLSSLEGLNGIDIGDCYVVDANRHLYFYNGSSSATSTEPYGWTDMGEFKGADGLNSYMHIAWADSITFANDGVTPSGQTGFTTVYGANNHNYDYDWIGFCTDNDINDPTTYTSYKWNYQKGKDGSEYEYVYMRAKSETVPTIDETGQDGSSRSRTDDEYLPAVGNYNSSTFAGSRFTDDPQGVSETWPCEYQASRKKENGAWQSFSAATLHRKYGQDGTSPYVASLDTEFVVIHTTGKNKPASSQQITIVPSLYQGDVRQTLSITDVKRNGTAMIWSGSEQKWHASGITAEYNASTGKFVLTYGVTAVITAGKDFYEITIAKIVSNETVFSDVKMLTVSALGSDRYELLPSDNQILASKEGSGYDPDTFTLKCGYSKTDIDGGIVRVSDVSGQIDDTYKLYFRRRNRLTGQWEDDKYYLYSAYAAGGGSGGGESASSGSASSGGSSSSSSSSGGGSSSSGGGGTTGPSLTNVAVGLFDAVEFILCTNLPAVIASSSVSGLVCSVTVPVILNGDVGATGPSYYYLGEWADQTDDEYIADGTTIQTTEYERPFVSYTVNGATSYFMFVGQNAITTTSTRGNPASDTDNWEQMSSQNKYIIASAVFSKFAKFGGAIFNGDWMYSQYGKLYTSGSAYTVIKDTNYTINFTIGGTTGKAYNFFNPYYPAGGQAGTFAPNWAVDLKTGTSYQNDAYLNGEIHSTSGNIGGFQINPTYLGGVDSQNAGVRIYADGRAFFGRADSYTALETQGKVELIGNGQNIVVNTTTGSSSSHGDFVVNGWIKLLNVPSSATGLANGEVYVDSNGFLKIKT